MSHGTALHLPRSRGPRRRARAAPSHRLHRMALIFLVWRAAGRLPGVPDEGDVLRAVRLRLQPAARLRRAAVLRPRDVPRRGRLRVGARRQGVGLTPELASCSAPLCAGVLGWVTGLLAIRRQGIYFAMITLALAQMVFFFCLQAPFTGGEDGIQAVPRGKLFGLIDLSNPIPWPCTTWCWRSSCSASLLIYRIVHSPFGQVLKAIRENEPRAISLGYDTDRYKLLAFVLSATLAGLAGRHQGHRVPARLADRRALGDVGRGGADDAARRHGHDLRPGGRRRRHHHDAELPGAAGRLGHGGAGRDLRGLRAAVPPRHRRRARPTRRIATPAACDPAVHSPCATARAGTAAPMALPVLPLPFQPPKGW
jgi:hypothetical protein